MVSGTSPGGWVAGWLEWLRLQQRSPYPSPLSPTPPPLSPPPLDGMFVSSPGEAAVTVTRPLSSQARWWREKAVTLVTTVPPPRALVLLVLLVMYCSHHQQYQHLESLCSVRDGVPLSRYFSLLNGSFLVWDVWRGERGGWEK